MPPAKALASSHTRPVASLGSHFVIFLTLPIKQWCRSESSKINILTRNENNQLATQYSLVPKVFDSCPEIQVEKVEQVGIIVERFHLGLLAKRGVVGIDDPFRLSEDFLHAWHPGVKKEKQGVLCRGSSKVLCSTGGYHGSSRCTMTKSADGRSQRLPLLFDREIRVANRWNKCLVTSAVPTVMGSEEGNAWLDHGEKTTHYLTMSHFVRWQQPKIQKI